VSVAEILVLRLALAVLAAIEPPRDRMHWPIAAATHTALPVGQQAGLRVADRCV